MNQVQVEHKSYQMPPQDGFTVAHFLTVADIDDRFDFTKRSSEVAFRAEATTARRDTSRSRTRGSLSTSGAVRHPTNHR